METEYRSACGVPCAASPSGPTSESGGAGGILSVKGLSTGVCAEGQGRECGVCEKRDTASLGSGRQQEVPGGPGGTLGEAAW